MSKGIGKVEKYIIECIEKNGGCIIHDAPFLQPARSRAAKSLLKKGLVKLFKYKHLFRESSLSYNDVLVALKPNDTNKWRDGDRFYTPTNEDVESARLKEEEFKRKDKMYSTMIRS